jgi:hypothetical protein
MVEGRFFLVLFLPIKLSSDNEQSVWIWRFSDGDDNVNDMYLDNGDTIRFRVESLNFVDASPDITPMTLLVPLFHCV